MGQRRRTAPKHHLLRYGESAEDLSFQNAGVELMARTAYTAALKATKMRLPCRRPPSAASYMA